MSVEGNRPVGGPWGLAGGDNGAPGRNIRVADDGTEEELPAKGTWQFDPGERIRIETPSGGGWGKEEEAHKTGDDHSSRDVSGEH